MPPRICVSIAAESLKELERQLKKAAEKTDLAEVRLDRLKQPEKALPIIKKSRLEVIATLRPAWEGGWFKGSEKKRAGILKKACGAAGFVDVELKADFIAEVVKEARKKGSRVIVSWHDFEKTPGKKDLETIFKKEKKAGADVCKIVTNARQFGDNNIMLDLVLSNAGAGIIAFCMGEVGIASRILSPLFGADFTYACLEYGKTTAPGQVSVDDVKEIYRVMQRDRINSAA